MDSFTHGDGIYTLDSISKSFEKSQHFLKMRTLDLFLRKNLIN
jgi:hypothetical protein